MDDQEFKDVVTKMSKSGCNAYFNYHRKMVDPYWTHNKQINQSLKRRLKDLVESNDPKWFSNDRQWFYERWIKRLD